MRISNSLDKLRNKVVLNQKIFQKISKKPGNTGRPVKILLNLIDLYEF